MANYKVDDLLADPNLEPVGKCSRCGRKIWKRATVGKLDEMTQPDGGICGGRFVSTESDAGAKG